MTLNQFLRKNDLSLSLPLLKFCNEALRRMLNTKDVSHDLSHIERIFSDLDKLLEQENTIQKTSVHFDVLLLAICWHDIWKSERFPTTLRTMLIDQYWDGPGSMYIFVEEARKIGLDEELIRTAGHIIRDHGRLRLAPTISIEAKILYDLDGLDQWSLIRLDRLKEKYLHVKDINPTLLKLGKFYFDHFMASEKEGKYYFAWSRQEFKKRKALFIKETNELLNKYGYLIRKYPTRIKRR